MSAIINARPITLKATDRWSGRTTDFTFGYHGGARAAELRTDGAPTLVLSERFLQSVDHHWDALAHMGTWSRVPLGDGRGSCLVKVVRWRGDDAVLLLLFGGRAPGEVPVPVILDREDWAAAAWEGWTVTCPHCALEEPLKDAPAPA